MNNWALLSLGKQFPQLSGKNGKGGHRPSAGEETTFLLLWWQNVNIWWFG